MFSQFQLHGAQWMSSLNIPRFASDLKGLNPLEPLRESTKLGLKNVEKCFTERKNQKPDIVPEVEFDWNGAGLVNPLDGEIFF